MDSLRKLIPPWPVLLVLAAVPLPWLVELLTGPVPQLPPDQQPKLALEFVATLLIAAALGILAGYLLREKTPQPPDTPTMLSQRGSYTNWLRGISRLGPVFGWAGDRRTKREKASGNFLRQLFGQSSERFWYEGGVHWIGPGPYDALHAIIDNGKVIWGSLPVDDPAAPDRGPGGGPIYRTNTPSGSVINVPGHGSFAIYWGEESQPINTRLGSPGLNGPRIGISSRWPFMCYLDWIEKRLGPAPQWGTLTYVFEKRPTGAHVTGSDPWIPRTVGALLGDPRTITAVVNGAEGTARFQVDGEYGRVFIPGTFFQLAGNSGLPDQVFEILASEEVLVGTAVVTRVYPRSGLSGATADGTIERRETFADDGANLAHAQADLLFDVWPQGLGKAKSDWDMTSLQNLGLLMIDEDLRCVMEGAGNEGGEVLGHSLQDAGCFLPIGAAGLLQFRPIRTPTTIPTFPPEASATLARRKVRHQPVVKNKTVYAFHSREHKFRDATIGFTSSAQVAYQELANVSTVQIPSTNVFNTAAKIAVRRSLEDLAGTPQTHQYRIGRGGRRLIPGDVRAMLSDYPDVLRVLNVTPSVDESITNVDFVPDTTGVDPYALIGGRAGSNPPVGPVVRDLQQLLFELPEYLTPPGENWVVMPRIRASISVEGAKIHLSDAGVDFTLLAIEFDAAAGGVLIDPLPASALTYIAQGPTFTIQGPDIGNVLDLSSDLEGWRQGRQSVFIGGELIFVQKVTILSPTIARLDGLLRARYSTRRQSHLVGAPVFVVQGGSLAPADTSEITSAPIGNTIYGKNQPFAGGSEIPLEDIPAESLVLNGWGQSPVPVSGLTIVAPWEAVLAFETGDDIDFEWAYSTPQTERSGAGETPAGIGVTPVDPEGQFELLFYVEPAHTLVRTEILTGRTYTYTAANRTADMGGNSNFSVQVRQMRDGYRSAPSILQVTFLP